MIVNTNIVDFLLKQGFFPDHAITEYYILYNLYNNNQEALEIINDNYSSKRIILLYYSLCSKGLIEESENKDQFIITEKGKHFIETLLESLKPKNKTLFSNEWFDSWMDLWPSGIKTGGKLVKSDKKTCFNKMKKFLDDTKYPTDLVYYVTKEYISEFEKKNYEFMKSATYFIDKRGEGSELAARCENYKDSDKKEEIFVNNNSLV